MMRNLIKIEDIALMLNRPVKTVIDMRYKGLLPPALKIGNAVRFDPDDVERWLDSLREQPQGGDAA